MELIHSNERKPGTGSLRCRINILIFHMVGCLTKTKTNLISWNRSVSNHFDIFIAYLPINHFWPSDQNSGAKIMQEKRKSFIIHLYVKTLGKPFGFVAKRYLVDSSIRFSLRVSLFSYLVFPHWRFTGKTRVMQSRLSVILNIHNRASVVCIFHIIVAYQKWFFFVCHSC